VGYLNLLFGGLKVVGNFVLDHHRHREAAHVIHSFRNMPRRFLLCGTPQSVACQQALVHTQVPAPALPTRTDNEHTALRSPGLPNGQSDVPLWTCRLHLLHYGWRQSASGSRSLPALPQVRTIQKRQDTAFITGTNYCFQINVIWKQ
jgi:hypothetical protein